jgi:hypothetical protein
LSGQCGEVLVGVQVGGVAESCSEIYNRLIVEYQAEAENRSLPNTYQWAIDIENTEIFMFGQV